MRKQEYKEAIKEMFTTKYDIKICPFVPFLILLGLIILHIMLLMDLYNYVRGIKK